MITPEAAPMREDVVQADLRDALLASLARRSVGTMDPPWTAAFNAALDMVAHDIAPFLASARPDAGDGYATAFYEIAKMLDIGAQAKSPADVWRDEMRPKLEALTARPEAGDEVSRVARVAIFWAVDGNSRSVLCVDDKPVFGAITPGVKYQAASIEVPRAALAAMREGVDRGMVEVPIEVVAFLKGVGPLDGNWFGDPRPAGEKGNFWWRKRLPTVSAATPAQPGSIMAGGEG